MTIGVTPFDRRAVNVSLGIATRALRVAIDELDFVINATPTGERRNTLTDVNIHLGTANNLLSNLKEE